MRFIGIDPGLTGAIAVIGEGGGVKFYDCPTLDVQGATKMTRHLDGRACSEILSGHPASTLVTIERVNAMPPRGGVGGARMGVTSAFNFGMGFGIWLGILDALGLPYQMVSPVTWKKSMMAGQGTEKDASRQVAMRLFPNVAGELSRKKDHGRADALLIAKWASNQYRKAVS